MIIKRKTPNGSYYNFDTKKTNDMLKMITNLFENYNTISDMEYYKILSNFYEFELEEKDYIEIVNILTENNYNKIINVKTNIIDWDVEREGTGRDFSWWTVKYRMLIKSVTKDGVIEDNKEYTVKEIKELISSGEVYPIRKISLPCDDELKVNINDEFRKIDTLSKINYRKIDTKSDYFNIVVTLIKNKISLNKLYRDIKSYLLEFNNYLIQFRKYDEEYYSYIDDELEEIANRRIITIEKSLYFYDKYFKYKHKLEMSELYQKNNIKQLIKK